MLTCQMTENCADPVTHVDEKGYVYCASHGQQRKYHCRCRKLRSAEKKTLEAGNTISYRVK